jgi:hypothetical protein
VSISERNNVSRGAGSAQRLDIFTGAGWRRARTAEQKSTIVVESFEDGALVSPTSRVATV